MPTDDHEIQTLDDITTSFDAAETRWTEYVESAADEDAQRRIRNFISDRFDSFLSDIRS